uniref:Uncharacterized protein n=1 Tax=Romanomermis culicivorax TaxID=13658 RepID=A0A915KLK3_ROMCU
MKRLEPTCWIINRIRACSFQSKWFTDGVYFILHETTARQRWRFSKDFDAELILKTGSAPLNSEVSQLDYYVTVGADGETSIKAVFVKNSLERFSVSALQSSEASQSVVDWRHCSVWLVDYGLRVITTKPKSQDDRNIFGDVPEIVLVVRDFYLLKDGTIDALDFSPSFKNYCMQFREAREISRKVLYKLRQDMKKRAHLFKEYEELTAYFSALSENDDSIFGIENYTTPPESRARTTFKRVHDRKCSKTQVSDVIPIQSTSNSTNLKTIIVRSARIQTNSKITGWTNDGHLSPLIRKSTNENSSFIRTQEVAEGNQRRKSIRLNNGCKDNRVETENLNKEMNIITVDLVSRMRASTSQNDTSDKHDNMMVENSEENASKDKRRKINAEVSTVPKNFKKLTTIRPINSDEKSCEHKIKLNLNSKDCNQNSGVFTSDCDVCKFSNFKMDDDIRNRCLELIFTTK